MNSLRRCFALLSVTLFIASLSHAQVRPGADVLIEDRLDLLRGKRVGLVTNQTGRLRSGEFLLDALLARQIKVVVLFGPEHGIRGSADAGATVSDSIDKSTGIPIFSLYGKVSKPTPAMLHNVDVLVYDIQDVGARFYTYLSTMTLAMEAAAEKGIPFIVLDRPNPLGGLRVDGPVLDDSLRSFVGMLRIPVVYGLTCGELASLINGEKWLAGGVSARLTVVPNAGWKRSTLWDATGLPWVPPSPNIPRFETALVYPATCFLEGTNVSEGRGTSDPFCMIGAPFIDSAKLTTALSRLQLPGISFRPAAFTPASSKFSGERCQGVAMHVSDPGAFQPLRAGLHLVRELLALNPSDLTFRIGWFNKLMGRGDVLRRLKQGESPEEIIASWKADLDRFRSVSSKYYLY